MMPSRGGLHVLRAKVPRIHQTCTQNLSSTARPSSSSSRPFASPTSSSPPILRLFPRSARIAIPSVATIRYASTQQSAAALPTTPPSPPPPSPITDNTSSFSNIDTITIDELTKNAIVDPNAIPEQIGYLHAIGVDYGYGPTSMIQWVLEHAHVYLNLPWWGAIVLTAASLRLMLFPLYLRMSDSQARMTALAPVLKPFNEKMVAEMKSQNTMGAMALRQQISAIHKRAGISNGSIVMPIIAQTVIGFCGFKLMRALATLPVPGFKDGGFLWLPDLTMTDGYLLVPLIMATTLHLIQRLGGESGAAATTTPTLKKIMMYGLPASVFIFTSFQPGAVALWFAGSGVIGIPQALLLQKPAVRKYFGLAPIYRPKPGDGPTNFIQAWMESQNPTAKESTTSSPQSPHAGGKNAAYMRPQYQSPKIRTTAERKPRTIEAKLVDKSDMVQASTPAKGIFEQVKAKLQQGRDAVNKLGEKSPEQIKVSEREAYKRQNAEYEKRIGRGGKRR